MNPNRAAKNSLATLQDDGNFLVTEQNPDGSTKKSCGKGFDYPADTLLTWDEASNFNETGNDGTKNHDLEIFSFASITAATKGFSSENKLGKGGFGPVYKAHIMEKVTHLFIEL
ncbi:hypothetical protein REPUB_Repub17cG0059200 [Reevesia pubescens]